MLKEEVKKARKARMVAMASSWKGYDWHHLDRLHQKDYITKFYNGFTEFASKMVDFGCVEHTGYAKSVLNCFANGIIAGVFEALLLKVMTSR